MYVGLLTYADTTPADDIDVRQLADYLERQGEEADVVSLPARGILRRLLANFSFMRRTWLLAADFDLLLEDESLYLSFYRLNESLRGAVAYPIVAAIHRAEPPTGWQGRLWRRYLSSVDAFVFTSAAARDAVQALAAEQPSVTVSLADEASLARAHRFLARLAAD